MRPCDSDNRSSSKRGSPEICGMQIAGLAARECVSSSHSSDSESVPAAMASGPSVNKPEVLSELPGGCPQGACVQEAARRRSTADSASRHPGWAWLAQGWIHGQTGAAYGLNAHARASRYCMAHCDASLCWSLNSPSGTPCHVLQLTCLGHSTGSTKHTEG